MATGDKIVNLNALKAVYDSVDGEIENLKNILANQTSELPVGLTFIRGRYANNNTPIGSPTSSTNTIASTTAINYADVDYTFVLKSGYKVAFPSFENGVLKGAALSFITTPGEITLSDITANVNSSKLGTAFAIMIRNSEETAISPDTTNVLNVITKKVYGEIMAFRGTIPASSTLSNYNRAGWYTITQSGITSATDMPNGISSNFRGGILQNYTKIGSASPYTLQRYTDVGTYSQAFERRLNLASDGTVSSTTDWNTVQTRLTLATKPTISDAIDFTAELQTGFYRIAANATATNAPAGYDSTIVHDMASMMDAAGGFTFIVCGTDGMWVKPAGTSEYRRIDDNYKKYGGATWVAIGDSLTDGRYSYDNAGTIVTDTDHTAYYGYVASKILGFDSITEYGYGGMGWIHAATDTTTLKDIIDDTNLGNPDIITVALGINDRTGGTIGTEESLPDDGSISGAIRYCIETLCYKYPNSQLMLITPINAWDKGTQETGWSKRRDTGRSLDAIADLIKYWCTYYAVKCIDALNECPINVYNVVSLLPDGLHPTIDAHKKIGKWLAGAMPWRN